MAMMDTLMGPLYLGICFNLILYGLSIMQTYTYFLQCQRDSRWVKFTVAFLFLADTLNSAFDLAFGYDYLIKNFGNLEGVTRTTWIFNSEQTLTGIIAATVQCFFAYRVGKLTGKRWIGVIIAVIAIVQGLASIGTSIACTIIRPFLELQRIKSIVIVWLGFAVLNDIIITTSLVLFLSHNKTGFPVTDDIISRLIRLTVQTGAITSIWATLDLLVYLLVNNTTHLIFNIPLAKLYTNSVLSVLNARCRWELGSAGAGVSEHSDRAIPMRNSIGRDRSRSKSNKVLAGIAVTTRTDIHTDNYEIELGTGHPHGHTVVNHHHHHQPSTITEKDKESDGSFYGDGITDMDVKNQRELGDHAV